MRFLRPDIEGMGLVYGEIEHLLGLLRTGDVTISQSGVIWG